MSECATKGVCSITNSFALLEIVAVCRGMLQSLQQQANWDVRERKYVDGEAGSEAA